MRACPNQGRRVQGFGRWIPLDTEKGKASARKELEEFG